MRNTESGEDGMGKAILRIGDKVAEIELDDPYGRELTREFLGLVMDKSLDSITKTRSSSIVKNKKTKGKPLDFAQEILLTESIGESTARREEPGVYALYRNTETGKFTGILTTAQQAVKINLGREDDPESKISQIKKAVMAMPYYEVFSRQQLSQSLNSGVIKRGEVMKFALDYLENAGLIVKLKERNRSTHAILYKRINEGRDAPATQSGEDGAKAIPR